MKTAHTPGPWRADGLLIKAIDHGKWFGIAKAGGSKLTIDGNMANAALIAAAPELLAALEALHDATKYYFRDFERLHPSISGPVESARAALAKARGE